MTQTNSAVKISDKYTSLYLIIFPASESGKSQAQMQAVEE